MESYHPTLWRTCRVLANAGRLLCLKAVLEKPGSTVGETAARAGISETVASEHLRALQARGFLQATRQSRWVHYVARTDPLVASARPLLAALRHVLLKEGRSEAEIIHTLTAFTHPRRLEILRHLQKGDAASFDELAVATRISLSALFRHMRKLTARGLVAGSDQGWRLSRGAGRLEKTLLALLASGEA